LPPRGADEPTTRTTCPDVCRDRRRPVRAGARRRPPPAHLARPYVGPEPAPALDGSGPAADPRGRTGNPARACGRGLRADPSCLGQGLAGRGAHRSSWRCRGGSVGTVSAVAVVRPFRALRYDPAAAGPLDSLVAPPYDVIGAEQRKELLGRSPYNVVHLTLPDSEDAAAASLAEWREHGVLVQD